MTVAKQTAGAALLGGARPSVGPGFLPFETLPGADAEFPETIAEPPLDPQLEPSFEPMVAERIGARPPATCGGAPAGATGGRWLDLILALGMIAATVLIAWFAYHRAAGLTLLLAGLLAGVLLAALLLRQTRSPQAHAAASASADGPQDRLRRSLHEEIHETLEPLRGHPERPVARGLAMQALGALRDMDALADATALRPFEEAAEDWRADALALCEAAGVPLIWTLAKQGPPMLLDAVGQVRVCSVLRVALRYLIATQGRSGVWVHLSQTGLGIRVELSHEVAREPVAADGLHSGLPLRLRARLAEVGAGFRVEERGERRLLHIDVDTDRQPLGVESLIP